MRGYRTPARLWLTTLLLGIALLSGCADTLSEASTASTSNMTTEETPVAAESSTTDGSSSYSENAGGGGGKNIVQLRNMQNDRLVVRGALQLNRIPGPTVKPANLAFAYSSCTDCQSLAVAMQINLISRSANVVSPQNAVVAVNVNCTRCVTVALAYQYTYSVDDPTQVPPEVNQLLSELRRELTAIETARGITLAEAEQRLNAVINRFSQLAASLKQQRDEATESTSPDAESFPTSAPASVTPAAPTGTPEAAPSSTPEAAPSSTPAPTSVPDPTSTPAPTSVPDPTSTPGALLSARPRHLP